MQDNVKPLIRVKLCTGPAMLKMVHLHYLHFTASEEFPHG